MVWMGVSLDEPSEHKFNIIFRKWPAVIRTYSSRDKILNINPSILPRFLNFQVHLRLASSLPPFPQRAVEVPRKYIASFVKCNIICNEGFIMMLSPLMLCLSWTAKEAPDAEE